MFSRHLDLKKGLCGGELWSDVYFVATIGEGGNREVDSQACCQGRYQKSRKTITVIQFQPLILHSKLCRGSFVL
jgi:hypothetical protein